MPFKLTRGGKNVVAEVQRWQYFLLRQGMTQVEAIDGDFGAKTEMGTKFFQLKAGISATGKLDDRTLQAAANLSYTILDDDYYEKRSGASFPAKPAKLSSPSDASRTKLFGCFKFIQLPLISRPDKESIVIKGSCDDFGRGLGQFEYRRSRNSTGHVRTGFQGQGSLQRCRSARNRAGVQTVGGR